MKKTVKVALAFVTLNVIENLFMLWLGKTYDFSFLSVLLGIVTGTLIYYVWGK